MQCTVPSAMALLVAVVVAVGSEAALAPRALLALHQQRGDGRCEGPRG